MFYRPPYPALGAAKNFTVFIKNNIEFPKFGVQRWVWFLCCLWRLFIFSVLMNDIFFLLCPLYVCLNRKSRSMWRFSSLSVETRKLFLHKYELVKICKIVYAWAFGLLCEQSAYFHSRIHTSDFTFFCIFRAGKSACLDNRPYFPPVL